MTSAEQTAEDFLSFSHKFKLGCLLTEQQNPKTIGLSQMAKNDLPKAIQTIKELDFETITILQSKIPQLEALYRQVNATLESGGRIFVCGCGATGRLSIVLEVLWRQQTKQILPEWNEKVVSFMAGGDAALIKSVEDFEDHPEFAEQHLVQLGFRDNDLLIGSTEGGETSWVIGAVWKSTQLTHRKPFILYGNTDQILIENVQRSKDFILSDKIIKINCNVGYMALAGSTRMQSTTILMYAIGLTLLGCDKMRAARGQTVNWRQYAQTNVQTFIDYIKNTDFSFAQNLIKYESSLYSEGRLLTYQSDQYYAVSILTDTTERSPTFSLTPFANKYQNLNDKPSWCNLKILHSSQPEKQLSWDQTVERDWRQMLGNRDIRGLDSEYWTKYKAKVSTPIILGFGLHEARENTVTISHPLSFTFQQKGVDVLKEKLPQYPSKCRLSHHCLVKILLNSISTIIMGRLSRYESNIMTYVKPTNYKLIDRAARYVRILRKQTTYQEAVSAIYHLKSKIAYDDPIVLKVIEYLNEVKSKNE